ncbi:accessory factor UbiK family protein [Pseudomonas sp. NPDC007930]|uniref:accessory factor UbiK family protein n=1 Tax=Pseudomonas sp. NPDC007930 TaxID=3364417 RepID=UPI0036DFE778
MLAPKDFIDALAGQAARLLDGAASAPRGEAESQLRSVLQAAFAKLELVSREEFDSQMVVLARTRARVEALETRLAELEARLDGERG